MVRKVLKTVWVLTVLVLFAVTSCDNFYSTSWGKAREYDASKITLTQDNLKQWKKAAVGNPELSEALVKKIISQLDGKSGAEKAEFQSAGIEFAIEQSGLGVKILELAGSDLSNIDSEEGAKDLLKKVQNALSSTQSAADNIGKIVSKSSITGKAANETPKFDVNDPYGKTVDPSNVGLAVMVLALAEFDDIGNMKDISDLPGFDFTGDNPPLVKITSANASDNEIALAAYLNLIVSDSRFDDNQVTKGIRDAFLSSSDN
jgi:hypothetical protein